METIIKELTVENASLYVTAAGNRKHVAEFRGRIQIIERRTTVSILGQRCRGEKVVHASFLMSEEIDMTCDETFHSGRVYEAAGDVVNSFTGVRNSLIFAGLVYQDMNPITMEVAFEITDLELIQKLLMEM